MCLLFPIVAMAEPVSPASTQEPYSRLCVLHPGMGVPSDFEPGGVYANGPFNGHDPHLARCGGCPEPVSKWNPEEDPEDTEIFEKPVPAAPREPAFVRELMNKYGNSRDGDSLEGEEVSAEDKDRIRKWLDSPEGLAADKWTRRNLGFILGGYDSSAFYYESVRK